MTLIALDASGPRAVLARLAPDGAVQARWSAPLKPGLIETLPLLLQEAAAGQEITDIAICTGPGSKPANMPAATPPATECRFKCQRLGCLSKGPKWRRWRWPRTLW